jgi:two-component system CheB/CheR fusion protein
MKRIKLLPVKTLSLYMGKKSRDQNTEKESSLFPVVGIGASAGGLDALKIFLQSLPAKSGMAFVFVQHLSPSHTSILPELLERISPIPVQQISDQLHIEPDNLYIVPENKIVTAADGMLHITSRSGIIIKNDVIDVFFSSLGAVHQSYAVGIVLSGSLSDGTIGLQVIKSYGGITFAQDGGSATYNSMPNSAVKAGVIDFILPPGKIAEKLIEFNRPFHSDQTEDQQFKQILTILRVRKGVDFQFYKSSTLKRRIIRRMALSKFETTEKYLDHLRSSRTEQDTLFNDMLISVTNFFRDPATFTMLAEYLLPKLILAKEQSQDPLRIWVAGCATGEEAYSLAIILHELSGENMASFRIQIFATDVSEVAINKARIGSYRPSELEGLSDARIQQYFVKTESGFQVSKPIRDLVVFAQHNLLKDPPFSNIDLLSCRNVLIYLEPVLQNKVLTTFHYALNKTGHLLLGKSETIGRQSDIFTIVNPGDKLYSRKGPDGRYMHVTSFAREHSFREINRDLRKSEAEKDIFRIAEDAMLEKLVQPCVLINEKFDVIQFKGTTDPWLSLPTGKPSFNLLKITRDVLTFELRNLLHQAKSSGQPVHKYGVFYQVKELQHFVNLQVIPLVSSGENYYLVAFQAASSTGIDPKMFEVERPDSDTAYDQASMRVEHLERELIQARADMRLISEEQESTNEKLQSYNEELLSAGEEQQSLNEELETSKEELQSINEEIIIVNKELLERNEQLYNARTYADAIVSTIREPLLILDAGLRIRTASNIFYRRFKLNESQVENQFIYDIGEGSWNIPELRNLLERILPEKEVMHDFKVEHIFPDIGQRLFYLNARQILAGKNDKLILLAIEDVIGKS